MKVCSEGKWNALWIAGKSDSHSYKLYAKRPEEVTRELVIGLYGEKGKEMI